MAFEFSPVTREEMFLAKLAGRDVTPPDPVTRQELFYSALTGASVTLPAPVTREEIYLAKIAGENVQIPSEPLTRREAYLAKIAGEDVTPPNPLVRREMFLADWVEAASDQLVSVTGIAPLSLPNAVAKPITSLVQWGKCAQESTPTPTAPVPISCNNGTFFMADDMLPEGYKRLKGFTFNNNAYFAITDFKMQGSDTLRFSFKCTMASPACNVLGAYDGSSAQSNFSLYLGASSSAKYLRYNGGTYSSHAEQNVQYDVVLSPEGSQGMKTDSTWTEKEFESSGDLCIGTTSPTATSSKMVGDIIGDIEVDGRLQLIPCERVSDNAIGYYDIYTESFFEPTGDGLVSLGYDGSHYEMLVDGSETLILGQQQATVATLLGVVRSGGLGQNYADSEDIISGAVTRNWAIKAFDGTEDWTYSSQKGYYQCKISGAYTTGDQYLMCTHGVWKTNANNTLDDHWTMSSGYVRFYPSTTFASADAFKAWVKECWDEGEPIILVYRLKTPVSESATPYALSTAQGDNTVAITAAVSSIKLDAQYNARPE